MIPDGDRPSGIFLWIERALLQQLSERSTASPTLLSFYPQIWLSGPS